MISYLEWLKLKNETGCAGGVYDPKIHIDGTWQGAPSGGHLSSVGDVKIKKNKKKKDKKNDISTECSQPIWGRMGEWVLYQ